MRTRAARVLLSSLTVALLATTGAHAQCDDGHWLPGQGFPGANDTVYVTTTWDDDGPDGNPPKVIFAGSFTAFANASLANRITAWDVDTGALTDFGMGITGGFVFAATTMLNGDLVVAGTFNEAGGLPALRIARWDGKAWHAMGAGLNNTVNSLTTMPNGDVVAGGTFTRSGTTNCARIARWDGTAWGPIGTGITLPTFGSDVRALAVYNGDLIAAGTFSHAGGTPAANIARWDGATWSALGAGTGGSSGLVRALLVQPDNTLAVGGNFTTAGGAPASRIAFWNGTSWSTAGSGLGGSESYVTGFTSADGNLIVSGSFTTAGGNGANRIASWNGSTWSALGNGLGATGWDVTAIPGGGFVVGGGFETVDGQPMLRVARWNAGVWSRLTDDELGFNAGISSFAVLDTGELAASGSFTQFGETALNRIARWDGLAWSTIEEGFDDGSVSTLVSSGDKLFAGGTFTRAGEEYTRSIAQWSESSAEWFRVGPLNDMNGTVATLATAPNGDVLAGGNFSFVDGQNISRIARWNGVSWSGFGAGPGSTPNAIAVLQTGDVFAGNTQAQLFTGGSWASMGTVLSGSIRAAIVLPNGDLVIAGSLTAINATTVNRVARWNGFSWSALGTGIDDGTVSELLALPGGDIIAAGTFNFAGGVRMNNISRWNGATWEPMGLGTNGSVSTLALLPTGELAVGGAFFSAGQKANAYFARWSPSGLPSFRLQPAPQAGDTGDTISVTAAASAGYEGVTLQWQRNGVDITNGPGGASVGGGDVNGASATLASPTDGSIVTLTITGAQASDSGDYTAVITNDCGESVSVIAAVVVGGGSKCPADFNNDGTVNSTDVSDFVNQWFQDQIDETLLTDWDNNGVINSTDVSEFINAWFEDTAAGCGG